MKLIAYIVLSFMTIMVHAGTSISDVTAQQRYPWNGKVDISYAALGIEAKAKEEGLMVSLKVSAVDQDAGTTNVATTLSGDVSVADGTHKIVWDMNAQELDIKSTNVIFTVACESEKAKYCIIDLSAGSTATSYPIAYTNEIPGGSWSDEYKTTKLVLQRIEPGTCVVTVDKPYYVGVFEMTQRQWELVMGSNPSGFANNPKRPVEQVSYNMIRGTNKGSQYPSSTDVDENSFMGKLRTRTGLHMDLPTEAQWEYACRAGTTTAYSYGNVANGDYMWTWANSSAQTHDVATRIPNPWGLYDMHGNVCEWCLDLYSYDGRRVWRSGGWAYNGYTSSDRNGDYPSGGSSCYGFRLFMTLLGNTGISCFGNAESTKVELTIGVREAAKTEVLAYSTNWDANTDVGATAVVAVDGVTISEESGSGTVEWTPARNGTYELTHKVMDGGVQVGETLIASFAVIERFVESGDSFTFTPKGEIESFRVEDDWVISNGVAKVGDEVSVAADGLNEPNGKYDVGGNAMFVWQDYVAGTDPTNVEDQFRASVTMVEGKPVISYTPVLSETEAAKRVYTIYGKVKLQDEEWTPIPEGQEADYNFFKVTVKMK